MRTRISGDLLWFVLWRKLSSTLQHNDIVQNKFTQQIGICRRADVILWRTNDDLPVHIFNKQHRAVSMALLVKRPRHHQVHEHRVLKKRRSASNEWRMSGPFELDMMVVNDKTSWHRVSPLNWNTRVALVNKTRRLCQYHHRSCNMRHHRLNWTP